MVYVLKMVIFHGKLLKYQMVTLGFLMFDVQNTQGETLRFDMVARVQSDDWMLTPCPTY